MEDVNIPEGCVLVIESIVVDLPEGAGSNGGAVCLPCGDRFGGVDSIRRINHQKVEVLLWRVERGA